MKKIFLFFLLFQFNLSLCNFDLKVYLSQIALNVAMKVVDLTESAKETKLAKALSHFFYNKQQKANFKLLLIARNSNDDNFIEYFEFEKLLSYKSPSSRKYNNVSCNTKISDLLYDEILSLSCEELQIIENDLTNKLSAFKLGNSYLAFKLSNEYKTINLYKIPNDKFDNLMDGLIESSV